MVVGILGQDTQPVGQQLLAFSSIPKAARWTRNRHAQTAELLTSSSYKNVLIENVALRGRDRKRGLPRGAKGRARGRGEARGKARGMIKVRGKQLDGERAPRKIDGRWRDKCYM